MQLDYKIKPYSLNIYIKLPKQSILVVNGDKEGDVVLLVCFSSFIW